MDVVFEFKCARGHLTEKVYPPGTSYDKHAQISCPTCLKNYDLEVAYLTFAYPRKEKP